MSDFPYWLSSKDKAIAKALINEAGFIYCGCEKDLIAYNQETGTGYKLAKCHNWRLATAYGEVAIEITKDGAVFAKSLEALPNANFEEELRLAKEIIYKAAQDWSQSQPVQLHLF